MENIQFDKIFFVIEPESLKQKLSSKNVTELIDRFDMPEFRFELTSVTLGVFSQHFLESKVSGKGIIENFN